MSASPEQAFPRSGASAVGDLVVGLGHVTHLPVGLWHCDEERQARGSPSSWRPMIPRMISEVPPEIVNARDQRKL